MSDKKLNKFLIFILFIILGTLISAFIIEYGLGHKPCNLCLYQRVPYIISIFLILEIIIIKKYLKNFLLLLSFVFIVSAGLAFYHFGIEQGFFSDSFVCKGKNLSEAISKEQLLKELKQSSISCKDTDFKIVGLSLASINGIFSLFLSAIFIRLFTKYGKN